MKKREVFEAKEDSEKCELLASEESSGKLQNASAISALLCCVAALYMQHPYIAIFCFCVYFVLQLDKLPSFFEKHGEKIFIIVSALILCFGIATRILMFAKCRTLWNDEGWLAENIITRNWTELLASPLSNSQSAPVLYIVAVKAICSVLGYSEFSLRIFSFFSFLGLLVCEWILLRNALKIDNVKTAFALIITVVVPSYVYYSNELKPYMSDALFVVLTLLLYILYTQNKISFIKLTVFYVLILGFCTPVIFFIGGVLTTEFLTAAFARDKKHTLHILISGLFIVALFGLYYHLWMSPSLDAMYSYWPKHPDKSFFNVIFIVMVISLYFFYTRMMLPLIILIPSYVLISVICPPTVVFVGGIIGCEFLVAVFAKNKKQIISILISMLSIAIIFGLYYLLRTSSVSEALNNFWNDPMGKTRFIAGIKSIFSLDIFDCTLIWVFVPFALLGIYSLIKQKNKVAYSIVLSLLFVCLASSIGKWPLNGRLWMFLPAIVLVCSSVGFDLISKGNNISLRVLQRVAFCLFSTITVVYIIYWLKQWPDNDMQTFSPSTKTEVSLNQFLRFKNMRTYTDDGNPLIRYVKEHIKDDEVLYVYPGAVATVKFKTGYTRRIGQTDRDNIIYGVSWEWDSDKPFADLDTIIKSRKVYLLFQHYWHGIIPGLNLLQQYGTFRAIWISYDTPLFYFEANE
jgi:hypothetical protein